MIRIAVNQSGSLTMVPLKDAQVRTANGWIPVKSTDKIYLNGQWHEVGEETVPTGNQLRLIDSLDGIDILFTPVKAGTLDLSGFGLQVTTVTDTGRNRVWYGVSNVSSYPMILASGPALDGMRTVVDWVIIALTTSDTSGGSIGYEIAYADSLATNEPWDAGLINYVTGHPAILTQVDSYVEPLDPSTLFPN